MYDRPSELIPTLSGDFRRSCGKLLVLSSTCARLAPRAAVPAWAGLLSVACSAVPGLAGKSLI